MHYRGTARWCSWLRHCATSREVACSIPDGANGIFHWHNPSGRTMVLGSTQPLKEMSSRYTSWGGGKVGRCVGHLHVPTVLKSGILNLLEPSGLSRAALGLLYLLQDTRTWLQHYAVRWGSHDRNTAFWNVKPSSLVGGYYRFEETRIF